MTMPTTSQRRGQTRKPKETEGGTQNTTTRNMRKRTQAEKGNGTGTGIDNTVVEYAQRGRPRKST